jgi:hypothetical protein
MEQIKWNASKEEHLLIGKIVKRAVKELEGIVVMDLNMDISATHLNGTPLDLEKLLAFDDFNFSHDIYGIMDTIDRTNGQLAHGFLPRCSKH